MSWYGMSRGAPRAAACCRKRAGFRIAERCHGDWVFALLSIALRHRVSNAAQPHVRRTACHQQQHGGHRHVYGLGFYDLPTPGRVGAGRCWLGAPAAVPSVAVGAASRAPRTHTLWRRERDAHRRLGGRLSGARVVGAANPGGDWSKASTTAAARAASATGLP